MSRVRQFFAPNPLTYRLPRLAIKLTLGITSGFLGTRESPPGYRRRLSPEAHFSHDCLPGQADTPKQSLEARIRAEVINPQISFDVPGEFQGLFLVGSF
jgi:hypothetical protein